MEKPSYRSELIVIRHGSTRYTNIHPDITPEGVNQSSQTARSLKAIIAEYDQVIGYSSPASRARATGEVFLRELSLDIPLEPSHLLRPFDIKDLAGFLSYDREHSTPRYGEMLLTDPLLREANPLIESVQSMKHRSKMFLNATSLSLDRYARQTNKRTLGLAFTHFEIASYYYQGIFGDGTHFPIQTEPAVQNGEAIRIGVVDRSDQIFTFHARERVRTVKHFPIEGGFRSIS